MKQYGTNEKLRKWNPLGCTCPFLTPWRYMDWWSHMLCLLRASKVNISYTLKHKQWILFVGYTSTILHTRDAWLESKQRTKQVLPTSGKIEFLHLPEEQCSNKSAETDANRNLMKTIFKVKRFIFLRHAVPPYLLTLRVALLWWK